MSELNFTSETTFIYQINKIKKINLLDLNRNQMRAFFKKIGEKSFYADQVMRWIYHHGENNFYAMSNISKILRNKLEKIAEIRIPEIAEEHRSSDGTIKWSIAIDNQRIETVYIPENNRATLCISSQIGCALKCKFCSTAQHGFNRNLRVSEIIGQIWRATQIIRKSRHDNFRPITNIVMMGMGEPLLNLANVVSAVQIMLDDFGFGFSKRRITISTSGIVPAINTLSNMIDVALAISLHAPNDKIRDEIMPINKKFDIKSLLTASQYYLKKTKANRGRITIEYVMLNNVNDSVGHAHELAKLLKNISCKVNLIPWNSFPGSLYRCSSDSSIDRFFKILISYGLFTTIRKSRGRDISAACGQLIGNVINRTKSTMHTNIQKNLVHMN